jgi:hypothetical protein
MVLYCDFYSDFIKGLKICNNNVSLACAFLRIFTSWKPKSGFGNMENSDLGTKAKKAIGEPNYSMTKFVGKTKLTL